MVLSAPADRLLILSRQVALPEGERCVIEPAGVLVEGGRIAAVWPLDLEPQGADALSVRAGARLVDYGDALVTPAFINAHTHVALNGLRGAVTTTSTQGNVVEDLFYRIERSMTPGDIRAFARMGAYESLLSGVGLVWDHYYAADAVAEALSEVGLAGVVAPTLQDESGPGEDGWEEALELTETLAGPGYAARGIYSCYGPHATDTVSDQLWTQIAEASRSRGIPVHAHLAQSIEEVRRSHERNGCGPIEHLRRLGVLETACQGLWAHVLYGSKEDLPLLHPSRHTLVFCPYSQMVFGFPARPSLWSSMGLSWAIATDCAASNDSMNVQKELRFARGQATVGTSFSAEYERFFASGRPSDAEQVWSRRLAFREQKGSVPSTDELLSRVWRIPGALHPEFRAGEIAAGQLANLLVWDTEHPSMWPKETALHSIVRGDTTGAIHTMYVLGREIGEGGDFHRSVVRSSGYRSAMAEASERWAKLVDQG